MNERRVAGRLALAVGGAVATRVLLRYADQLPEGVRETLGRINHRGEPVSLVEGPVVALAATVAAVVGAPTRGFAAAAAVAGLGAGAVGLYDDVVGARSAQRADKGFRGHLVALRQGRVSTGMVKVAGIGVAGLLAGRAVSRGPIDTLLAGGVVAGTANLVNLLDLRPGRALKAGVLLGTPLVVGPAGAAAAGLLGVSAAALPEDLGERTMLGDSGANALGALLGLGIAAHTGRWGRAAVLGGLVALTLTSERVSFTAVIERTPGLRHLDRLGRRPLLRPVPAADARDATR